MTDEQLLEQLKKDYDYAYAYWQENRDAAKIDRRYIAGDPWDPKEKLARNTPGQERPCLVFDELNQYVNQLVNTVRMDPRAVALIPMGYGAEAKQAEQRSELIRGIEYKSKAQQAYTTGFQCAVESGMGWWKVCKEYVRPKSFDQDLVIKRVANPDSILVDPDCKEADYSDMRFLFEISKMSHEKFKKEFPGAKATSFVSDLEPDAVRWMGENDIMVASYWYVEKKFETLLHIRMEDGTEFPIYQSGLKQAGIVKLNQYTVQILDEAGIPVAVGEIVQTRREEVCQVRNCLTNGFEILEKTTWEGTEIPYICCTGKEMYVDLGSGPKRMILSLTRLARDPYMLYCYYRSTQAEVVGQTPKTPYIGYEGQFDRPEWDDANRVPYPYLQAKAQTEATGNAILPLPQKVAYEPPIQALEMGAESARRAIQAAMGINSLPTAAQRNNEKSGIALERIASQQAQGSFHFIASYEMALMRTGRILNEMIVKIYDTPREVLAMKRDDTPKLYKVSQEAPVEPAEDSMVLTQGDYGATISSGPSQESQREEAQQFLDGLANTPFAQRVMDLIVRMKQLGPIGEEIAERLTPPDIAASKAEGIEIPPVVQARMAELQQSLEALNAYAEELEKKNKVLESDILKVAIENQGRLQVEALKGKIDLVRDAAAQDAEFRKVAASGIINAELRMVDGEMKSATAKEQALLSASMAPPNDTLDK